MAEQISIAIVQITLETGDVFLSVGGTLKLRLLPLPRGNIASQISTVVHDPRVW